MADGGNRSSRYARTYNFIRSRTFTPQSFEVLNTPPPPRHRHRALSTLLLLAEQTQPQLSPAQTGPRHSHHHHLLHAGREHRHHCLRLLHRTRNTLTRQTLEPEFVSASQTIILLKLDVTDHLSVAPGDAGARGVAGGGQ